MQTHRLDIRGLSIHVQTWGDDSLPKLFLLHGWMDCGATFQYVAPFLQDKFHIIAPDLRGFGRSDHAAGGYWFPDYFADLEVLLNHFAPNQKVDIAGHSMGGNIVLMYAGINPERINRVMSLEAIGLPPTQPQDAVGKYRQWMQQILSNEPSKVYPSVDDLKQSIYKGNPSLPKHIINDLVDLWGKPVGDSGAYQLKHDHNHRYTNPVRYQFDDVQCLWQQITAKVGLVLAAQSLVVTKFSNPEQIEQIKQVLKIADEDFTMIENCHHMLHLEQPEQTAQCLIEFFA